MSSENDYLILQNHYKNLSELTARLYMIVDLYKSHFGMYVMRLKSLLTEYKTSKISDLTLAQAQKILAITNGYLMEDFQQLHLIVENFADDLNAPYAGIIKSLTKERAANTPEEDMEFLIKLMNAPSIKEMEEAHHARKAGISGPPGNA